MKQNRIFHLIHYSAVAVILTTISAWSASAYSDGKDGKQQISIEPGDIHEVCMRLKPPEQLHYAFTTSDDLAFNIHYHTNHQVIYPLAEHFTSEEKSIFKPDSGQHYCLMWTNNSSAVIELSLQYEMRQIP